jgi:hypothetical protein
VIGVVYAIECVGYNAVKIGWARDANAVAGRIKTLQIGNPHTLNLIATREGDISLERRMHRELRAYRIRGEWFTRDVVPLFAGATGSDAIVLRCTACGGARRVAHTRKRSSGMCRACASKRLIKVGSRNHQRDVLSSIPVACCACSRPLRYDYNLKPEEQGTRRCRSCAMREAWLDPEYKERREIARARTRIARRIERCWSRVGLEPIPWDNIPVTQ